MKLHPQDIGIMELVDGLSPTNKDILQHILQCESCLARLRAACVDSPAAPAVKVVPLSWISTCRAAAEAEAEPVSSLERLQAAFERERASASQLLEELLLHSPERQRLLALNHSRYHTWSVCDQLLNRSFEENLAKPARGEQLASLAVELTSRLDGATYGAERIEDLKARAWAYLGNSRRIQADLEGAEQAFEHAMRHLKAGTGEPMERAVLLDLRASLLRAQRRQPEAIRVLQRAITIFREIGETHRAGRSLIGMSVIFETMGESERVIPTLYEALELIDAEREPRMLLNVWHNLIHALVTLGRFMEAQKLAIQARPLFKRFTEPTVVNRRRWVDGAIARGLGQEKQAETHFLAARAGFLEEGAPYEVALVSLELAGLYLDQGRNAEAARVTEEALPIFTSRGINRESLAAFLYWKEAVEAGREATGLAAAVAAFLKRSRQDPSLRFERPSLPGSPTS